MDLRVYKSSVDVGISVGYWHTRQTFRTELSTSVTLLNLNIRAKKSETAIKWHDDYFVIKSKYTRIASLNCES